MQVISYTSPPNRSAADHNLHVQFT